MLIISKKIYIQYVAYLKKQKVFIYLVVIQIVARYFFSNPQYSIKINVYCIREGFKKK